MVDALLGEARVGRVVDHRRAVLVLEEDEEGPVEALALLDARGLGAALLERRCWGSCDASDGGGGSTKSGDSVEDHRERASQRRQGGFSGGEGSKDLVKGGNVKRNIRKSRPFILEGWVGLVATDGTSLKRETQRQENPFETRPGIEFEE